MPHTNPFSLWGGDTSRTEQSTDMLFERVFGRRPVSTVVPLGTIPLTALAKQADGTLVANFSGAVASPIAITPDAALVQRTYYAASTSGTATYTATLAPVPTAYVTGTQYVVTITSANTGASTMNFNSLGAKSVKLNGAALLAGQLVAGATYQMVYDGTNLQISGVGGTTFVYPTATSLVYGWHDSDDFITEPYPDATNVFGAVNFSSKTLFATSGTGAGASVTLEKGHPGTWQFSAGTTNNSGQVRLYWGASASSGNVGNIYLDSGGGSDQVWYVKTDATLSSGTTRYQIGGGWGSNVLFNGGTERALWQYTDNVSSGVFRITVTSNNVQQTEAVGTTTVAASTWYRMRLNINAAYTAITLYISVGTVSGGVTTWGAEYQDCQFTGTMPRAASGLGFVGMCFINKTVGTGNSAFVVDGWESAIYLAAPRGG